MYLSSILTLALLQDKYFYIHADLLLNVIFVIFQTSPWKLLARTTIKEPKRRYVKTRKLQLIKTLVNLKLLLL